MRANGPEPRLLCADPAGANGASATTTSAIRRFGPTARIVDPLLPDLNNPLVAYDEDLANRIRELVGMERGLTERKMFGGLAFLIDGTCRRPPPAGGLLVQVDPDSVVATQR